MVFDARIYRAAFAPPLLVLAIVGFSLSGRSGAAVSTLAPDAFEGQRAFAELRYLAARFPARLPGSGGDEGLARYVARAIGGAVGGAGGGFQVSVRRVRARTIAGTRTLTTIVARRAGSTGESPILILAHRDAAAPGSAAELSGTAALIELARVFAHSETRRTIVLVSTSGGSGGDGGAASLPGALESAPDAAIVLGDLAGTSAHTPFVLGWSASASAAPDALVRTLQGAISQEVGARAGDPGLGGQLAHLALPLSTAEEAPLNGAGIPAVLVQVSGERGPGAAEPVSQARLQNFGRAVLSAVYALDESPDVKRRMGARLLLGRQTLPGWSVRLLAFALLLPPLLMCVDALARLRRRRERVGRWLLWVTSCALPLLVAALFAMALGALGIVAAPHGQLRAVALAADGSASAALAATALVLGLALAAWPSLVRRLALPVRPAAPGAGLAAMLVLLGVACLAWLVNPFACLLVAPACHVGALAAAGPRRRAAAVRLAVVALSLAPAALVTAVYARELGLGPLAVAQSAALLAAGGQLGGLGTLLWCLALGSVFSLSLLGSSSPRSSPEGHVEPEAIVTRGPLSYAGPGSLGGTESALRR